jgi:hypothetical protein
VLAAKDRSALARDMNVAIDGDYVVEGTELMAKCPSRYDGAQPSAKLE